MAEDRKSLLRSTDDSGSDSDLEALAPPPVPSPSARRSGISDLLRHLDRGLSGRRTGKPHSEWSGSPLATSSSAGDELGDGAPPEWALLLIGCLLGLATGICVAAFNRGVREI